MCVHMWLHVGENAVVDLVGEILKCLSVKDARYCRHMYVRITVLLIAERLLVMAPSRVVYGELPRIPP